VIKPLRWLVFCYDSGINMEQEDSEEIPSAQDERVSSERSHRRSGHAQQRLEEGRRIRPGFGDAQQARPSQVYLQPDGRYVVRGPRGREHVFAADGAHITSIDRSQRAHQKLVRSGKRTRVTLEQFHQFKELFK
jgi:hypothetical protein